MVIYYIMYKIHTTKDFSHVVFRHCSPGVSAPRFEAAAPRWAISETGPLPEGNIIQQIYVGNMLITVNMLDVYFALSIYIWYDLYLYTWLIHLCIYIYDIWHILVCLYIGSMKVCETSDNLGTEMVPDAAVGFYWISRFCWYFLIFFAESASRFLAIYYRSA
jgi:hypothetical protein